MNKTSEKAAQIVSRLKSLRAELQETEAEIARLQRLMRFANRPSARTANYSGVATQGGQRSDPTAKEALREETSAGRELRHDIAALTRSGFRKRYVIDLIESALEGLSERARFVINRFDIDSAEWETVYQEYMQRFPCGDGFPEGHLSVQRRRSDGYRRIAKSLLEAANEL